MSVNRKPPVRMRINAHGIIGIVAIGAMAAICHSLQWKISWLYVGTAVSLYALAVIGLTFWLEYENSSPLERIYALRFLIGSHLAFAALAFGVLLDLPGFWANTAFFVAAVAVGITIPFLLIRSE